MAWNYVQWSGRASWFTANEYCQSIQRCRRDGSIFESGYQIFERSIMDIARDPKRLFCIDDLGIRGATDSVYEIILSFIDCRKGKPTIFTSNMNLDGIREIFDERTASRLSAGTVIEVTGSDQRRTQGIRIRA